MQSGRNLDSENEWSEKGCIAGHIALVRRVIFGQVSKWSVSLTAGAWALGKCPTYSFLPSSVLKLQIH